MSELEPIDRKSTLETEKVTEIPEVREFINTLFSAETYQKENAVLQVAAFLYSEKDDKNLFAVAAWPYKLLLFGIIPPSDIPNFRLRDEQTRYFKEELASEKGAQVLSTMKQTFLAKLNAGRTYMRIPIETDPDTKETLSLIELEQTDVRHIGWVDEVGNRVPESTTNHSEIDLDDAKEQLKKIIYELNYEDRTRA